ncbi:fatty acid synthase-like, partial [Hyposmocoma kahamanoa]|uniref:fatty acid synthase-like n=1 Tax=Hyposmocoma kahamanoa TaxID=1477025 RepID=UPI000E6D83F2
KNPITADKCRWNFNHPEVSNYTGKSPGVDRFDAQFFKVHYWQAHRMDILCRKALEQAYQAIYDAGLSSEHLSGQKVGVFIGTSCSETDKAFIVNSHGGGFGIAGCNRGMFPNRISYWLNAKGPSVSVDASDCSGLAALEMAFQAIHRGDCVAALVGATNICLHPQSSVHYARIIKMSKDGKTKSFDQNADGCAKSDAVNMLLLQKAKDAKRVYAELVHVKSGFTDLLETEVGPKFGFYRDSQVAARFINEFYKEAGVPPHAVEYVEAFGAAVSEADKEELEAIETVFCKERREPLLVGSVMSNIGYTEAASGISAVTKVILGYQRGKLAANMHCTTPRQDIQAIRDGRMKVV